MALETNLSRSPYFDTFSTNSGYHQILFRPAVAVQTRELNELQSIQQDQIAKFGRQIFTEGSVVEGCQLSFESNIPYIKILDEYSNGSVYGNVNEFLNLTVKNEAGVTAIILNSYPGGVAKSPDLNTLYIRYTDAAPNIDQRFFNDSEQLTLYTAAGNKVGNVVIANSSTSGDTNATGFGYIVHAQEGVIFQKGFFIRTEPQSYVLSKYSCFPDRVSIGYTTIETIETPESNTSLLDNASGAPNYSAPGAHRLKLTPVLTSRETLDTTTTTGFFAIADFAEGQPSIIRTDPNYSNLGKQLAERTYDESGNYIINPFYVRLATKYDTNDAIVPEQLKLEIEKGLAYVNGYRIETVGKLINSIRRGTDTKTVYRQTTTSTMGSYVFVNEFAGIFDPTAFQSISLRGAVTKAITDRTPGANVSSFSPAGSEIGTANIIAVEFDNGTPGTNTCVYRVYLTNISCSDFSSVKSIYSTDGSKEGYADIILDANEKCVLNDSNLQSLTFPYNQKAIKTLFGFSNDLNTAQFDFKAKSDFTIQTDGKATIPAVSTTGGTNLLPYSGGKVLSNVQERDFIITCTNDTGITAANIAGYITGSTGSAVVTGHSTFFSAEFSNGNLIRIANVSNTPIYKRIASVDSDTQLTLTTTLGSDQGGTDAKVAYYLVAGEPIGSSILPNATISITSDQASANLELNRTFNSSFNAEVLYNVRRTTARPLKKKLFQNLYVKIDTSSATKKNIGPWCLGFPDVYRVKHIYVGSSTHSTSNPDLLSSFTLDNGQRDSFYGLSYLNKKSGVAIDPGSKILVELEAFKIDATTGAGYFTVDSYPVDDTGLEANTILTQNIPLYSSYTSGQYDLRNTIDFRVFAANTVVYTDVLADANTNPPETISFSPSSLGYIPVPESSFESDLEYYVGRYDKVGLDAFGNVKIIEGAPDESPVPPPDIPAMMTLVSIKVPPFPSLPPSEALTSGRPDLSADISYYKNKRYTMRDISTLDKRIENLEYYTSLNALELSSKTLLIDNGTGGNRFQYGILADPMKGHDIGNVIDPQYRIAIDYEATEARPMVEEIRVDLKYNNTVNTKLSNNERLISLNYSDLTEQKNYISQPFASKYRNCSQDVTYVYKGHVTLTPEGDWTPDITTNPALNVNLDLYTNFATIADAMGTIIGTYKETSNKILNSVHLVTTVTGTDQNVNQNGLIGSLAHLAITQAVTRSSDQVAATTKLDISESNNTKYDFGDVVHNIALQPYIKPQDIFFSATGMKPNAVLYAFFDETNVTANCSQVITYATANNGKKIPYEDGPKGTLKANANGIIEGHFSIPARTFYAGEREFKLVDVNSIVQGADFIQTRAMATFFGTNLSYSKQNITLNTTSGQLTKVTGEDKKTVVTTSPETNFSTQFTPYPPPNDDPIIQTFSVSEREEIAGVFLKSVDLYFFKKDLNLGIRVEIREMFNGFPGFKVLPFSSSYLTSSSVNVSSDSSVATTFVFDAPVFVENKKDYAIAIMPDASSPNYAIWTAELSASDVKTNAPIFINSGVGVMFTSSDNKTWTAYQKEDIKFGLTRINFNPINSQVNVLLTNDDTEYLSANNLLGTFNTNEKVYFSNNTIDSSITVDETSTTITDISSTSTISVNDLIYIRNSTGANTNVRKVISKTSTSVVVNAVPTFTDSVSTIGKLSGNGGFYGYIKTINYANGYIMIGNSTANSTVYLTENHLVISSNSQSSTTISKINTVKYDVVMPKFSISTAPYTTIDFSLKGISNTYTIDSKFYNLIFAQETPFYDKERIVLSKSDEFRYYSGQKSLTVNAAFVSTNNKLSPIIDQIKSGLITTYNVINDDPVTDQNIAITIQYNNANGTFNVGDNIALIESGTISTTKTANVVYSYASNTTNGTLVVNYIGGASPLDPSVFTAGANVKNISVSGNVVANMQFVNTSLTVLATEKTPDSGTAKARYISKKVVLADGQDAEDIKVYVAAYKPAGTDIYVFAKFWNSADSESFENKNWTQLLTDNTLVSSKANINDFIEYQYSLKTTTETTDYTAYLNETNGDYILRYKDRNGNIFDNYKAFAIKIVLLSSDSVIVPRIQDYRAIAVTSGTVV
jgi:hypothetical protein